MGALLAPRVVGAHALRPRHPVRAGGVGAGGGCDGGDAGAAAAACWPALSFFLFGAGPIIWTITTTTLRQSVTPGAMLGRVSSVFLTVNAGARPVGAALGGAGRRGLGRAACLWLALAGFVLQAAIILASSMNGLRRLPELRVT